MITNANAQKVALHNYGPFGFEVSIPYQNTITKKYTGHERDNTRDPATKYDLDYMHARYYSPWQHRFLSVDPIGGDPRQPQSWNAFSYVLNNPMNLVDPYGMVEMLASSGWQSEGQVCNGGIFGGPWCAAFANADSNLLNSTLSEQNGTFFALFDAYKNGTSLDLFKAGTFGLSLNSAFLARDAAAGFDMDQVTVPFPWGSQASSHRPGWNDPGANLTGWANVGYKASYGVAGVAAVTAVGLATGPAMGTAARAGARQLFGKGGLVNRGRYLRVGFGRKGGQRVFRLGGNWVKKVTGRSHWDLWKGGPL